MYTRERPIKDILEFQKLCKDIGIKPSEDGAYELISLLAKDIKSDKSSIGLTINISGSWGIGKTSYTNLLKDMLKDEFSVVDARSMFYGNFDEYVESIFGNLYRTVSTDYGIKLKELRTLSSNITVSLEAGFNIGIFSLKTKGSTSRKFKKELSNDVLLNPASTLNSKLLEISPKKILIVLDDIDRLQTEELVTALRLIEVLKQLNNIIVVAIGDSYHVGSILDAGNIPGSYTYTRKVFDHSIHLTRTLRNTETIIKMMVGNICGRTLDEDDKLVIKEAYHFLIIRQIIQNIRSLISEKNDPTNVGGPIQGEFWSTLESADDEKLGPIYKEIRGFFSTLDSIHLGDKRRTHKIWTVNDEEIVSENNLTDPLALLTSRNSGLIPWEAKTLFRSALTAEYWSTKIIPIPDEENKIQKYRYDEGSIDVYEMMRRLDGDERLPISMLGDIQPESRWSIVNKTLGNLDRDELDNDRSLPQLNDLRLIHNFATALSERVLDLKTMNFRDELGRLKLFVECVESYEAKLRIEKGEI